MEKNYLDFVIKENIKSWTVLKTVDKIKIKYSISKKDCKTFEDLVAYINKNL